MRLFSKFKIQSLILYLIAFSFVDSNFNLFMTIFIIAFFVQCYNRESIWSYLFCFSISFACYFGYVIFNYEDSIYFNFFINKIFGLEIRDKLIEYINTNFNEDNSSLIKLLIFNYRDSKSFLLYNQMANLSIIYLFVVSGLHINLIAVVLDKLIKVRTIKIILTLSIFFFILIISNFAFPIFRAVLFYTFSLFKIKKENIFYYSILLNILIAPYCVHNVSFQLTYLSIFALKLAKNFYTKNKIINYFTNSLFVNLFLFPIIINFSKKFSIFFLFFPIYFMPIILFLFFTTILLAWIPNYEYIFNYFHLFFVNQINFFISINLTFNFYFSDQLRFFYFFILNLGILLFINKQKIIKYFKKILYNFFDET